MGLIWFFSEFEFQILYSKPKLDALSIDDNKTDFFNFIKKNSQIVFFSFFFIISLSITLIPVENWENWPKICDRM